MQNKPPPLSLQNYSESETRALESVFRYYSKDGDGSHIEGKNAKKFIYLAQLYCVVNELGQDDGERSRMKNAIQELSLRNNDDSTPLGCISSQNFLRIIDHGREGPVEVHNFHFIRMMAEFERRSDSEGEYLLAKEFMNHRKRLQNEEESRQLNIIKQKQLSDKRRIVIAHDDQLIQFSSSWDQFIDEFEAKSTLYIDELKQTHQDQLASLQKEVVDEVKSKPQRWSRELVDWRKRESLMAANEMYQEAQRIKTVSDALELKERSKLNANIESSLRQRELNLKKQQDAETAALMQRIDSKRREFKHQQQTDYDRMLQRNKLILLVYNRRMENKYTLTRHT